MVIPSKMAGRCQGVGIFIYISLLIVTLRNTAQVQSFTPTLTTTINAARFRSSALLPPPPSISAVPKNTVSQYAPNDRITSSSSSTTALELSGWDGFEALDEFDDDMDYMKDDGQPVGGFADENDEQERKAEVGSSLPTPEVFWDGEPIFLPQGECLPLTEENVQGLLAACRVEIGTMFGYTAENRGVGITGGVDFVELDGPNVVVTLKGRFWHQRPTVLDRVGAYIMGRIPEVVDVIVWDEAELSDEVNNAAS